MSVNANYLNNGYSEIIPDWSMVNTKANAAINSMNNEISSITNGVSPCLNISTFWGCNETSQFKASSNKFITLMAGIIIGVGNGYATDFVISKLTAWMKGNLSAFLGAAVVLLAFVDWSLNNADFYLYVIIDSLDAFTNGSIYEKGFVIGVGIYTLFGVVKIAINAFQEVLDGLTRLINAGRQGVGNIVKTTSKLTKYLSGKPLRTNTPNIRVSTINNVPSVYTNQLLNTTQTEASIAIKSIRNELTTVTYQQIQNDLANIQSPAIGRGSTGRTYSQADNLQEQIGMKQVWTSDLSIPNKNISEINFPNNPSEYLKNDTRWPGLEGWRKYSKTIEYKGPSGFNLRKEIHYNYNINSGQVDDFKFKDNQ